MRPLNILVAASEVAGYAKTGGLADVCAALPVALARQGHNVAVVMPYHRAVRYGKRPTEVTPYTANVAVGHRTLACRIHKSVLPNSNVPIYFVDAPDYFDRDDNARGKGLYQQTMPGGYKSDYPDNAERFVFFSRAVLEVASAVGFQPDILHANDWQTGLVPVYLEEMYRQRPEFKTTRSVFTIHNIAYQGMFNRGVLDVAGLPGWLFNHNQLEYHGHLNLLKSGIVYSSLVSTVSPTYSKEIQTPEYGCGLESLLRLNQHKLRGIVNGVDYAEWNPSTDPHLVQTYDESTVKEGKAANKAELQKRYQLPVDPTRPVLGMVARLVNQKGLDLVMSAAPGFLDLGCQLVFLGDGDREYHDQLQSFRDKHPNQVGIYLGFHEPLAHLVEAGSDLFLMPSRYEPCGLNQIYSLKYGTPPVVRATGGLADTIMNSSEENMAAGKGTGFSFNDYTPSALYETVKWAVGLMRNRPADFHKIVVRAMQQDWSWDRSAEQYEAMYRS
jgi:starch synthase